MRYVTHQFSHVETLERARRWLVQAGIDPSRIEAHTHGMPRISVAVEGQADAEVSGRKHLSSTKSIAKFDLIC